MISIDYIILLMLIVIALYMIYCVLGSTNKMIEMITKGTNDTSDTHCIIDKMTNKIDKMKELTEDTCDNTDDTIKMVEEMNDKIKIMDNKFNNLGNEINNVISTMTIMQTNLEKLCENQSEIHEMYKMSNQSILKQQTHLKYEEKEMHDNDNILMSDEQNNFFIKRDKNEMFYMSPDVQTENTNDNENENEKQISSTSLSSGLMHMMNSNKITLEMSNKSNKSDKLDKLDKSIIENMNSNEFLEKIMGANVCIIKNGINICTGDNFDLNDIN